ncbi:hypothetical protein E2562_013996 [Oryza meyeriana var. granulata]|uniref:DUF4378 domain-containing protein n=1 Tax=Oryza meyeriana var. granulata TaxID=110450 RepID=A0A6G1DI90_9ORYZ|nr:hypothetical protein E2562_013996 [Oryza meyeriana var. granulata]KAF0912317.1 hypothetical protein E2562_013996 [Oryza meyeriana var. granulata]KAF0912318.1 hypothetical protein E2562_013996 [Oryza meyeriana var. granulata]
MDVEKPTSKGHGFFSLFDWGKKSKKRLVSGSGSDSPASRVSENLRGSDGGTSSTRPNSFLEDALSLKESSEHSCSSSVIDDEALARRGPTVVARLMGLDSMPVASSSGSYTMPLTVQEPLQNSNIHDELIGRSYVGSPLKMPGSPHKMPGSPHKMPGSPIDRFRMEALPPRLAKRTLSVTQYKSYPVKNPNHISSRNAADIMKAASRIIGPGVEDISSYRVRDVGYPNAVRAYSQREIAIVQQRPPRMNEALKKRDGLTSYRLPGGKPLDGSLKCSGNTSTSGVSQSNGGALVGPKVMASSRSSPDSRATNFQGREGINKTSRKLATQRDPEQRMVERNGINQCKNSNQVGTTSSSNVLVQNNRKQNAMVKHKVNSKPPTPNQQRSNTRPINATMRKVGTAGTLSENNTQGNRNVELRSTGHANRRHNSTAKTIPKPRRLSDGRTHSEKSHPIDKDIADRSQRRVRHNIVIDEQSPFPMNKKKISTDIVSFTFTSPVDKALSGYHLPNHLVEKQFIKNLSSVSNSSETSNAKFDSIDGDYLGLLLEQKLRELTSGVRSPYCKPTKGVRVYAPSSVLEDSQSACETSSIASTDYDRESMQSYKDGKANLTQTDLASKNGQSSQSVKYDNDAMDKMEIERLHLSPLSTWDASVSTETCSSTESWRSANGTKIFISTEGATTSDSVHFGKFLEVDAFSEYSDTASSITVTTTDIPPSESSSSCRMDCRQEIDFIREILNASPLNGHVCSCFERFVNSDILDPQLLEDLNGDIRLTAGVAEGKALRMGRRLLFDGVNEILSVRCAYYFNAGYGSWFLGMAVLQKLTAEEIYAEMTDLKVAEEWMVDELVYKEMSSPLGSWVDFKMESYEAGIDITTELLGSLIDEMVADLLVSDTSL